MSPALYLETKQRLETLTFTTNNADSSDSEHVQALVLIATCESMRTYHRKAWMSTGLAFRLVQLLKLHEVDTPTDALLLESDYTVTEIKRRVSWTAHFLEHLFRLRDHWLITLNEHVVSTRACPSLNNVKMISGTRSRIPERPGCTGKLPSPKPLSSPLHKQLLLQTPSRASYQVLTKCSQIKSRLLI